MSKSNRTKPVSVFCISARLSETWVIVSDDEKPTANTDNICNEIVNGKVPVKSVKCNYKSRNPKIREL